MAALEEAGPSGRNDEAYDEEVYEVHDDEDEEDFDDEDEDEDMEDEDEDDDDDDEEVVIADGIEVRKRKSKIDERIKIVRKRRRVRNFKNVGNYVIGILIFRLSRTKIMRAMMIQLQALRKKMRRRRRKRKRRRTRRRK